MPALNGLRILVPESRELDLFTTMLEAAGATAVRCPLVQILPLEDTSAAARWIEHCIEGMFDDLILLTGEGLRHLLAISGPRRGEFIAALQHMRLIVRGPKPARALREVGVAKFLSAPVPTSGGVLTVFGAGALPGRKIAVQLYPGQGAAHMVSALRARGAEVMDITPYRYAADAETQFVAEIIRDLAAGKMDVIVFTASLQIERLLRVARDSGLDQALAQGLARTAIAAMGPVVQDALRKYGLHSAIQPETSFHMKPLVRAIIKWRAEQPPPA